MHAIGYSHVVLLGSVASGSWHNPPADGRAESAALSSAIPEAGRGGDTILVEGKIAWQRTGDGKGEGRMIVACWRIVRLGGDAPLTG